MLEIRDQLAERSARRTQWRDPVAPDGSTLIEHIQQGDGPARTMLIQKQNRVAQFDLPLNPCTIEQLALEASVRGWTIADIIGKVVRQVMEKDLVGEILRNGDSPYKV